MTETRRLALASGSRLRTVAGPIASLSPLGGRVREPWPVGLLRWPDPSPRSRPRFTTAIRDRTHRLALAFASRSRTVAGLPLASLSPSLHDRDPWPGPSPHSRLWVAIESRGRTPRLALAFGSRSRAAIELLASLSPSFRDREPWPVGLLRWPNPSPRSRLCVAITSCDQTPRRPLALASRPRAVARRAASLAEPVAPLSPWGRDRESWSDPAPRSRLRVAITSCDQTPRLALVRRAASLAEPVASMPRPPAVTRRAASPTELAASVSRSPAVTEPFVSVSRPITRPNPPPRRRDRQPCLETVASVSRSPAVARRAASLTESVASCVALENRD